MDKKFVEYFLRFSSGEEQRTNVKILVKLGKSDSEIIKTLHQVCGTSALKPASVYKWYKHFEEDSEEVDDDLEVILRRPNARAFGAEKVSLLFQAKAHEL